MSPSPGGRAPGHADIASGVFETILVIGGKTVELESHLGRLAASVSSVYGSQLPPRLGARVVETARGRSGPHRLRVRAYPSTGVALATEISILPAPEAFSGSPGSLLTLFPAVLANGLGRHKWHDRKVLADQRQLIGVGGDEQLLVVDEDGSVLETESANVFAVFAGLVRTPPLDGRVPRGQLGKRCSAWRRPRGSRCRRTPSDCVT